MEGHIVDVAPELLMLILARLFVPAPTRKKKLLRDTCRSIGKGCASATRTK